MLLDDLASFSCDYELVVVFDDASARDGPRTEDFGGIEVVYATTADSSPPTPDSSVGSTPRSPWKKTCSAAT